MSTWALSIISRLCRKWQEKFATNNAFKMSKYCIHHIREEARGETPMSSKTLAYLWFMTWIMQLKQSHNNLHLIDEQTFTAMGSDAIIVMINTLWWSASFPKRMLLAQRSVPPWSASFTRWMLAQWMATRRVNIQGKSDLRNYWCFGEDETTTGIVWVRGVQICNGAVKKYHRPYFLGGPYFQYQFLRRIFWREEKNNGRSKKWNGGKRSI